MSEHHVDCLHVRGGSLLGAQAPYCLCRCDCHLDCKLTGRPPSGIRPGACTCPRMLALRAASRRSRQRPPPQPSENPVGLLVEGARHAWDERRKRREVDRLLSERAPGMSREDVRAMMIEQYQLRGLMVPPQPLLGYKADLHRERDPDVRARIRADMGEAVREEVAPLLQMAKHMFAPRRDPR